jgi:hypothetical protein
MAVSVGTERLIERLRHVDDVRRDLAAFLGRFGVALRAAMVALRRGVPASAQAEEATAMHVEMVQKLDDMHSAVHQARVEGVRVLVEEEGLPVSAVARLMGRPRQLVARLYQQGRNGHGMNGHGPASANGGPGHGRAAAPARTRIPPAAQ